MMNKMEKIFLIGVFLIAFISGANAFSSVAKIDQGIVAEQGIDLPNQEVVPQYEFNFQNEQASGIINTIYVAPPTTTVSHFYGAGEKIASQDSAGVKFYITDQVGSTTIVIDAKGDVVSDNSYYSFGNDKNATGTLEKYKFTGKEKENATGIYYYGARYYEPDIGRFLQADSLRGDIKMPQSLNKYAYVRNNPLKFVDPTGNEEKEKQKQDTPSNPGWSRKFSFIGNMKLVNGQTAPAYEASDSQRTTLIVDTTTLQYQPLIDGTMAEVPADKKASAQVENMWIMQIDAETKARIGAAQFISDFSEIALSFAPMPGAGIGAGLGAFKGIGAKFASQAARGTLVYRFSNAAYRDVKVAKTLERLEPLSNVYEGMDHAADIADFTNKYFPSKPTQFTTPYNTNPLPKTPGKLYNQE
jgi:RHS repeat-associated protein